jgi:tetratricopeptide (TPR) repeat protein
VQRFFKRLTGISVIALGSVISCLAQASQTPASQPAAAAKEKKVKDQGEYDLFTAVTKETDPNKKITLLNTWKEKYPDSDYKLDRLQFMLLTYQQLNQPAKMIDTAKEILAIDPKDIQALYWISTLTPTLGNVNPDALDLGEKAANGLLAADKPEKVSDDAWKTAKTQTDAIAYSTLGWIANVRKNYDVAEQNFKKSLEINPNAAQVSYWLGNVLLMEKKPERQSEALYDIARAASYDGTGSLNPDGRKTIDAYLTKAYGTLHGDQSGLPELKAQAKASAAPPANFHIQTAAEVAVAKDEDLKKTNPQLAIWLGIKGQLLGADGQTYFDSSMKGAAVPKLKGWLVAAKPATRSKELLVNMDGKEESGANVTLKLVGADGTPLALTGKPEVGTEIEFEGVPDSFTKEPFMVSFNAEKSKITGLKVDAAAPAHRPVHKK